MNKPNIIFILIDDMGWKDLSCTGSQFYETPNIDSICDNGMRFTNGYAAAPVCSPTRASILSGKYPANVGVTNFISHNGGHPNKGRLIDAPYADHLPLEDKCLAVALKEGGYQTWHVGKWHIGQKTYYPEKHGFEINIGGCLNGAPGAGGYFSPWTDIEALKDVDVPDGIYLTDYLTDQTIKLLKKRDKEKPFFLNLWYYSVHTPIQAKEDKIQKYRQKLIDLGLDKQIEFSKGDFFPGDHKKEKRIQRRLIQSNPVYAAMIESLDENIGRILNGLKDEKIDQNTIVIFYSDNGGLATAEGSPTCNLPLAEGKGWNYEGGLREPLIISWPLVIKAGSLCEVPVTSPDFYPTLLEAAGLDFIPEQHEDGVSLLPLLKGGNSLEREAIFWHFPHYANQGGTPSSAIRMGDWKLIEFFEPVNIEGKEVMPVELYNLITDEGELTNVSKKNPEIVNKMLNLLHDWRSKIEAKMPTENPDFKPWSAEHKAKGYQPWD